jgi:plastocyanin
MHRIRLAATATLIVATLVVAGCSSDEATPEATPAKAAAGTAAAGTAAAATAAAKAPADGNVRAVINDFTLPSPTVKVGGVIEFVNQDTTAHTATAADKTVFDSKTIDGRGGSFKFTATKAGTFAYACAIHPTMTGTVTVQP